MKSLRLPISNIYSAGREFSSRKGPIVAARIEARKSGIALASSSTGRQGIMEARNDGNV
jgi:hypothetical protein